MNISVKSEIIFTLVMQIHVIKKAGGWVGGGGVGQLAQGCLHVGAGMIFQICSTNS